MLIFYFSLVTPISVAVVDIVEDLIAAAARLDDPELVDDDFPAHLGGAGGGPGHRRRAKGHHNKPVRVNNRDGGGGMAAAAALAGGLGDEYFASVSVEELMNILQDTSLSLHHDKAMKALRLTIASLGRRRCILFLPQILPPALNVLRPQQPTPILLRERMAGLLVELVGIVQHAILPYASAIVGVVRETLDWGLLKGPVGLQSTPNAPILSRSLMRLLQQTAICLCADFETHVTTLLPPFLHILGLLTSLQPSMYLSEYIPHVRPSGQKDFFFFFWEL